MALGAVQSGYAGAACAYRKRDSLQEECYGDISFAAQRMEAEQENAGKVIGLATFPCGNGNVSYGMTAQYAADSTPEDPVIQVTADRGGERLSYRVNINDVNPWTASQLEMFALLSYTDDQGISDGGSFGSYHRLKVYADNAQMNGIWEGNGSWEDFVNARHDWSAMVTRMADDYFQAGVYSQHLNAMELNDTLSSFCIRHVDFDNLEIVDKSADTFSRYEPNIPLNLRIAWGEALKEMGGYNVDEDLHSDMDSAMLRRISRIRKENPAVSPLEAALQAAEEALKDLGGSLTSELENLPEIQRELEKQREVYQSFLRKLKTMREEEKGSNAEAAGGSDGAPEDSDLMGQIRERMEELLAMIKSGDTEASFQIGNSSFTIKEWERFLERFDDIEDAIRELMRERIQKETEKAAALEAAEEAAVEKEKASEDAGDIEALVSESTMCVYPASTPGQEDVRYITWYTEEGIFCRKAGQREGYEWSVYFEGQEEYGRVMRFLNGLDGGDNLRFAAQKSFWQDFLQKEPQGNRAKPI
ncbi:MAG: hypothetical protein NC331_16955 [Lachnospiraceae bacterium]|nr:hypothetical protein [Lachnospiraceae bacterium]